MQGDAAYRMAPEDLDRWYVRTTTGTMAPVLVLHQGDLGAGTDLAQPAIMDLPAIEINGQGAAGVSSGTALTEMDKLFKQLPQGISYELTGLSYQEQQSGAQAPALYALSILIIYLCLAALYEAGDPAVGDAGDSAPGRDRCGAAASLRGLFNDIYFQVGLLTTIGLSAKNAILIVEFAVDAEKRGLNAHDAALEAGAIAAAARS